MQLYIVQWMHQKIINICIWCVFRLDAWSTLPSDGWKGFKQILSLSIEMRLLNTLYLMPSPWNCYRPSSETIITPISISIERRRRQSESVSRQQSISKVIYRVSAWSSIEIWMQWNIYIYNNRQPGFATKCVRRTRALRI